MAAARAFKVVLYTHAYDTQVKVVAMNYGYSIWVKAIAVNHGRNFVCRFGGLPALW